jgi:hypothetical protein
MNEVCLTSAARGWSCSHPVGPTPFFFAEEKHSAAATPRSLGLFGHGWNRWDRIIPESFSRRSKCLGTTPSYHGDNSESGMIPWYFHHLPLGTFGRTCWICWYLCFSLASRSANVSPAWHQEHGWIFALKHSSQKNMKQISKPPIFPKVQGKWCDDQNFINWVSLKTWIIKTPKCHMKAPSVSSSKIFVYWI